MTELASEVSVSHLLVSFLQTALPSSKKPHQRHLSVRLKKNDHEINITVKVKDSPYSPAAF